MQLDLWTFVAGFEGGTYIAQVEANSLNAAIDKYVETKFPEACRIAKVKPFELDEFDRDFDPAPLDDTQSVYCICILVPRSLRRIRGGGFIIDIIKTEREMRH